MDITLSNDDVKYLSCALSLYMEKFHLDVQFQNEGYVYVPDILFERHIKSLNNLHDLQNRLLELLNKE